MIDLQEGLDKLKVRQTDLEGKVSYLKTTNLTAKVKVMQFMRVCWEL